MKKKWIVAFIAAGVLLLGGVTVYAVKTSSQSTVKVVSVSDMSGGGGWSDNSLSGNITSDVSQNIYLADSQTVKKIHVKEGDTVKVGDDLLTYDMTLENLDLEMKKLEKQGIELNIEKAKREITKLKNTKPSSDNDNEDPGFRTIASNNRHKLKDLFKKKDDEKYKNFMPWWMPSQWTAIAADYCYGETINSAVYKNKGSGANAVEWKTEIPKDGYYEVSIWNAKMSGRIFFMDRRRGRHKEERNQTYTIQYDKEKESVTLDLDEETEGWVSIGNFYLPQGEVIITLTDKVSGDYVIADAVKFTATEE